MKAPEKIWMNEDWVYQFDDKDFMGEDSIEYIRKDAFIEKAYNILNRMICEVTYECLEGNSTQHYDKMEFIEDFINYMKGE